MEKRDGSGQTGMLLDSARLHYSVGKCGVSLYDFPAEENENTDAVVFEWNGKGVAAVIFEDEKVFGCKAQILRPGKNTFTRILSGEVTRFKIVDLESVELSDRRDGPTIPPVKGG